MSLDVLKIGFVPLVDAAIPIVAADVGFAAAEGLSIELSREISWSNVRDRLTLGHFDAAHLLAPIAIATTLGLGGFKKALAAPIALGLNGNAITLAPHFHDELFSLIQPGADVTDPWVTGKALAALIGARRRRGEQPPIFGMTFPFSTHNYQLRLWLEAAGLKPDEDVQLAVVPPPFMVDALENGHVEGFCVGAPWNSVAVDLGIGRIVHFGVDLAKRCPEKVLAVRSDWLESHGEIAARLVRACVAAAEWIERPENHDETARRLGATDRLDVSPEIIKRALEGRLPTGAGSSPREAEGYMLFAREGATRPDPRHASWLFGEMSRWKQAPEALAASAEAVYRPDFYDAAVGRMPAEPVADPMQLFRA